MTSGRATSPMTSAPDKLALTGIKDVINNRLLAKAVASIWEQRTWANAIAMALTPIKAEISFMFEIGNSQEWNRIARSLNKFLLGALSWPVSLRDNGKSSSRSNGHSSAPR